MTSSNCFDINLPYGVGDNYALPYAVCRGAVFSSLEFIGKSSKLRPVYTRPTLIADYGPVQVFQTAGEQLNQGAADVYAELVRIALDQGIQAGERIIVKITADAFLKAIGRTRGLNNRLWLADEIARLKRASFRYELPGLKAWETSFIADFTEDRSFREVKSSAVYEIELNARMVQVYRKGWALLQGSIRAQLHAKKDTLAKALYNFYATHRAPHDITTDELKRLMGRAEVRDDRGRVLRTNQQNSKWIKDLKASLESLQDATGWRCAVINNTVRVRKKESKEISVDVHRFDSITDFFNHFCTIIKIKETPASQLIARLPDELFKQWNDSIEKIGELSDAEKASMILMFLMPHWNQYASKFADEIDI